jgi:hypothetical protein
MMGKCPRAINFMIKHQEASMKITLEVLKECGKAHMLDDRICEGCRSQKRCRELWDARCRGPMGRKDTNEG